MFYETLHFALIVDTFFRKELRQLPDKLRLELPGNLLRTGDRPRDAYQGSSNVIVGDSEWVLVFLGQLTCGKSWLKKDT